VCRFDKAGWLPCVGMSVTSMAVVRQLRGDVWLVLVKLVLQCCFAVIVCVVVAIVVRVIIRVVVQVVVVLRREVARVTILLPVVALSARFHLT